MQKKANITILRNDWRDYGCPECGFAGVQTISKTLDGGATRRCGNCNQEFTTIKKGQATSHPRRGRPVWLTIRGI